jgi:hypothetical protein
MGVGKLTPAVIVHYLSLYTDSCCEINQSLTNSRHLAETSLLPTGVTADSLDDFGQMGAGSLSIHRCPLYYSGRWAKCVAWR